jgi:hypothetical protein
MRNARVAGKCILPTPPTPTPPYLQGPCLISIFLPICTFYMEILLTKWGLPFVAPKVDTYCLDYQLYDMNDFDETGLEAKNLGLEHVLLKKTSVIYQRF